jgi:hypothetical protein
MRELILLLYNGDTDVHYPPASSLNPLAHLLVKSKMGTTQGGPEGGVLYSAAQKQAIDATLALHPSVTVVGIMDDKYFAGLLQDVLLAVATYAAQLALLGLKLQASKSKVIACDGNRAPIAAACAQAGLTAVDGFMAAGTPLGSDEYVNGVLAGEMERLKGLLGKMHAVYTSGRHQLKGALQHVVRMVRMCVAPASVNHWLRTVPPATMRPHAARFDTYVYATVLRLLGLDPDTHTHGPGTVPSRISMQLLQASTKEGGGGMYSALHTCIPAYVGSWALVGGLFPERLRAAFQHHGPAQYGTDTFNPDDHGHVAAPALHAILEEGELRGMDLEDSIVGITTASAFDSRESKGQSIISDALRKRDHPKLLKHIRLKLGNPAAASVLSCGEEGAALLHANPSIPTQRLEDPAFRAVFKRRLLIPLIERRCQCPHARCKNVEVDQHGGHTFVCTQHGKGGLYGRRGNNHKELQRELVRVLKPFCGGFANKALDTNPLLDLVPGWTRKAGVKMKKSGKGDVMITDYDQQTITIVDLVITHASAKGPNAVAQASKPGVAAQSSHTDKISSYKRRYDMPDYPLAFVPAAFETGGRWHPTLRGFLAQHIKASINPQPDMNLWPAEDKATYSARIQTALTTIGVALQRIVARPLLQHMADAATYPPLVEDVAVAP